MASQEFRVTIIFPWWLLKLYLPALIWLDRLGFRFNADRIGGFISRHSRVETR